MYNPEDRYIRNLDVGALNQNDDLGKLAESVVIAFFNEHFPGQITIRPATEEEDSGLKQIVQGKQIDAVAYDATGEATMCMQITTARDVRVRREKLKQLMERPFVSLAESRNSVPKVLVNIDPIEVSSFLIDHDFSKHIHISEQILESTVQSLGFVLTRTQIPEERQKIRMLIDLFETKKGKPH
jgi:hypothetical protein